MQRAHEEVQKLMEEHEALLKETEQERTEWEKWDKQLREMMEQENRKQK